MNKETIRALVLLRKGEMAIQDIPRTSTLSTDQVRIKMHTVGICGSDVHYYTHGKIGQFVVRAPMVLGHEGAGVVTEVGSNVTHLRVGDRVCMEPGIPSAQSRAVREGRYNLDPDIRFWATPPIDGCLAQEVVHPAALTYRLPDNVSFAAGALIEPFAVGLHAATKARIKPGDGAVVIGAGTVGILTAAAAHMAGASSVLIADIADSKLENATKIPNVATVNTLNVPLKDAIAEKFGQWGPQVVFEASGAPSVFNDLWRYPCPGGTVVIVGMPTDPVHFDTTMAQSKELRIETVFRYANVYEKGIAIAESGSIDLDSLVTATFSFDESQKAFDRFIEGRPSDTKIQILFGE